MQRVRQICVVGGSGFVGSALVHRLSTAGYDVKVLTRRRESSKHLILLPNVQVTECDVFNEASLSGQLHGQDAVINLAGILHESGNATFESIHVDLATRIADICCKQGVPRLLHMSALKASADAKSAYLRSKAAGEQAVLRRADELQVTVFRPSVIFGRGDHFLSMLANVVNMMPVVAVAKPNAKFQPIWVEDVAYVFLTALENVSTYGRSIDLGGPQVYTLKQLIELTALLLGKKRRIVSLNDKLSYYQAYALELMPFKLMTRDNLLSMEVDSVCDGPISEFFGHSLASLEAIAPEYIAGETPRSAYERFRSLAGRTFSRR
ncbi:complex I NDUFA9 subunit family protein [Methylobacillus flagellatus]|uniref:NAD-dependent epimerase/dehydratase n=1 Tax=Methylobacillus flagellatus (strain ATCC 51484 / DSM 6875 / VKM B-1610 / KT) TaxID=265072 RepID=Q1GZ10_METFK|nr:complex I NDUFA9 subunit family protein [Methylobacillus flagellatus]ABE50527.1 NAD-dependent epimerase/dehydratase [Methylobacillus flagellatus KT]